MTRLPVRAAIERLPAYRGIAGARPRVRLDGNENPLGPPPAVLAALRSVPADAVSRYPLIHRLRASWARRLGARQEELLLTSGSGPALGLTAELVLDPGDRCVLLEPSFELYAWAAWRRDAEVIAVAVRRDLAFPTAAFRDALARRRPRLVFLGYPDNPTGTMPSPRTVRALAARYPGTLFVLDEAYVEFTGRTLLPLARSRPNVLVTRTFSKALGLAGERVGGVIGDPALIERLGRINVPYPITGVAAVLAEAALSDRDHVRRTVRQVRRSRRRLVAGLERAGVPVRETAANFVLTDWQTAARAAAVTQALAARGIAVRDRSHLRNLVGVVRVSVGTDQETERVLDEVALLTARPPRALLFDMDGTLVDVSRSYDEAIFRTVLSFLPRGRRPDREEVLAVKRDPKANDDIDAAAFALARRSVRPPRAAVAERFQAIYLGGGRTRGLCERERWLVPKRVLRALARRAALAIVTGRPRAEAEMAIERAGVRAYFAAVITAEDARKKPDPAPVRRALRALGTRRAWMVGDGPADLLAARRAGIPAVGITGGREDRATLLRRYEPLALLDGARELAAIFQGRDRLARAGARTTEAQ